jgi:hypothetical protein
MVLAGISSTRPSSDNQRPFLDRAILWLRPRNIARYTHRVFPETKQHRSSIEHGTLVQKKRKAGISALASEFCTLLFRFYSAAWISTHLSNIPPLGSFSYSFFFLSSSSLLTQRAWTLIAFIASTLRETRPPWSQPQPLARPFFILTTTAAGSGTGIYGMHIERQGFTVTSGLSSFSLSATLHFLFPSGFKG